MNQSPTRAQGATNPGFRGGGGGDDEDEVCQDDLLQEFDAPMLAYELSYSILMSVPFHENHLLGFWTEDWIIHGFET